MLTLFLLTAMCGFVTAENENEDNYVIVCFCSLLLFVTAFVHFRTHFQYNMHPDLDTRSCHLPNAHINNNMFCQH